MHPNLLGPCRNAGSDSVGLGRGPRVCISSELPGDSVVFLCILQSGKKFIF